MVSYDDLKNFFKTQKFNRVIIVSDAETRVIDKVGEKIISRIPAGGVSVALDPIASAANAVYIARGKTEEEKKMGGKVLIPSEHGDYSLKRIFITDKELDDYYYGFSNRILWPLCHVAFERPEINSQWYEGFRKVNEKFAKAIRDEIRGKTFIWLHDYQLSLVPKFLGKPKDTIIGMFWHIPWPTWEVFRILPQKTEILESLLNCDLLGFHRGYHVRNFLETVDREFEARIDEETSKIYYNKNITTVHNLPLGIDADVIESLIERDEEENFLIKSIKSLFHLEKKNGVDAFFGKKNVILGVDRLDYTKGLLGRLKALDLFFEKNPKFQGNTIYLGLIAPSRESIPSYQELKRKVKELAAEINAKYQTKDWKPIVLNYNTFPRKDVVNFYRKSNLCLVTPIDDGMNLVSKEFVLASSDSDNPGMIVLSQFAGSAIDLTQAIIVNPFNISEVADAIKKGLEMSKRERKERIQGMAEVLRERNIYAWAIDFVKAAVTSERENRIRK